jgi:hypothetical protein
MTPVMRADQADELPAGAKVATGADQHSPFDCACRVTFSIPSGRPQQDNRPFV